MSSVNNFEYVRDYIDYFIEWYAKRSKYYISDQWLIDINVRMRKKYGRDFARNGPSKPLDLNHQFGLKVDGAFCRVSYYELTPMNSTRCYVCGALMSAEITEVANETWLSEYNTTGRYVGELIHGIPYVTLTYDIDSLAALSCRRDTGILRSLCYSKECTKLNKWRHGESNSASIAKDLKVKRNAPSYKLLDKQNNQYRKAFFVSRYLDYHARLKIAEDKLIVNGH